MPKAIQPRKTGGGSGGVSGRHGGSEAEAEVPCAGTPVERLYSAEASTLFVGADEASAAASATALTRTGAGPVTAADLQCAGALTGAGGAD